MMTRDEQDETRGPRGRRRGGPEGRGRRGGWQVADLPAADDADDWFRGRLPEGWFSEIDVRVDREEITVTGTLLDESAAEESGAEA